MVGLISAPKHAYDGCGEGAGTGASVGFDVGTCEKSNGDHRRALPESELCAVRCAYAVRRPSTRRRSPMTQAMYRSQERRAQCLLPRGLQPVFSLARRAMVSLEGRRGFCTATCVRGLGRRRRERGVRGLARRDVRPARTTRSRNSLTRRATAPPSSSLFLDSATCGCGDGAFIGDAVGRDVGMYVGTLLLGTDVGVCVNIT